MLSMVVGELKLADDTQELFKNSCKHLAAHAQHAFSSTRYLLISCLHFHRISSFVHDAHSISLSIYSTFSVDLLNDSAVFLVLSCFSSMFIVRVEDLGGVSSLVTCYVSRTYRPVLCSLVVYSKNIPLVQV